MQQKYKTLALSSLAQIEPRAEEAGLMLYARLFELDPSLETLFKVDLKTLGGHFMAVVGATVDSLDDMDEMLPYLRELGRRHVAYGVRAEHYPLGGEALLDVLQTLLGDDFTPEMRDAWTQAYQVISAPMAEGAQEISLTGV